MSNIPSWADPDTSSNINTQVVTGELLAGIEPATWQRFLGEVAEGKKTDEALKAVGIRKPDFNGLVRTNPTAKSQWEEARLDHMRRQLDPDDLEDVLVALMTLENGGYLNRILADRAIPEHVFYALMTRDPVVREAYEEAREIQAENMADLLQQIADDGSNDTYTDDKGKVRVDQDVVQRSRLRADTMRWRISKLHYRRFGDKQQVDQTVDLKVDQVQKLEAGRKRLEKLNRQRG